MLHIMECHYHATGATAFNGDLILGSGTLLRALLAVLWLKVKVCLDGVTMYFRPAVQAIFRSKICRDGLVEV